MSQDQVEDPKIQFRNVPEGRGKLFPLRSEQSTQSPSSESTPLCFGTRNCSSCVGLFLPLPNQGCAYVAHINAWVLSTDDKGKEGYDRIPSLSEGNRFRAEVLRKFQSVFAKHSWVIADIDAAGVTLVCPKLYDGGSWDYSTGWYVVDAIRDLLARPPGLQCDSLAHGFVFDPVDGEMENLPISGSRQDSFSTKIWVQKADGLEWEYGVVDEVEGLDDWEIQAERP
ncbi:hypothetical protein CLAFUW4_00032 [Fulvia fulva]|uniref:Uncharacterized protein n=1 Tax=Passalora fulva TaxID=5499 RepID=A0A9Q8L8L0_PASFU|nr:uncharacterized protein CLAFUR5_00031 [Fulvia fulva]KAK4634204.1 hypothetical protein CLAFUR4_00032 [Fulvia fulva]UJO12862.1 hypothetical protein CLAFUR5_00031 [Fulvia fulva]WPV09749.1 hypothetical protein CLAFUW4_00032 [Fulvia fulva]WPV24708.1 hypothetical protein CLAFUW7_00032 [Fulvia fulva]